MTGFLALRAGAAGFGLLLCVGAATLAAAQQTGAPAPRLSPKVEKEVQEKSVPAPKLSPKRADQPPAPAAAAEEKTETAPKSAETEPVETAPVKTTPTEARPLEPKPETAKPKTAKREAAKREAAAKSSVEKPNGAAKKPATAIKAEFLRPRDWYADGEAALNARLAQRSIEGRARNVILMIGDGMGVATATAVRLHVNQRQGGLGEESPLPYERFPYSALVKTYTVNAQTGDGAATATAIMSGRKTRSGVLGLDQTARRGRCGTGAALERIGDLFKKDGRAVGYVTTARVTHATPAAGYAVSADRLWEHDGRMPTDCLQRDIAQQLIERIGQGEVDLVMGGGRAAFFSEEKEGPSGAPGARRDGRNLIGEAVARGARYVTGRKALTALDIGVGGPLLGLFANGSMAYEHDRRTLKKDEPSLAEMAESAIGALEAASGGEGFFLMIEGGRIGQASHYGALHHAVTDGAAFAEAVRKVVELTDPNETLILVTADVAHSLAFNAYCGRGSPVPGLCYAIADDGPQHAPEPARDATGAVYETTGFLNGPGAKAPSSALTAASARDPLRRQRALIPMETQTTSAADAPAYAMGPWAHLLGGTVEQHFLFQVMRHAAFGPAPSTDR